MDYAQFVAVHKITMDVSRADANPHMDDSENMDHWRVTLRMDGRRMTTYFSKGIGHHGKAPDAAEVLECLAMDGGTVGVSFEDWCADYGYDTDSRKDHRPYQVCKRQNERLAKFMGGQLDALMQVES